MTATRRRSTKPNRKITPKDDLFYVQEHERAAAHLSGIKAMLAAPRHGRNSVDNSVEDDEHDDAR